MVVSDHFNQGNKKRPPRRAVELLCGDESCDECQDRSDEDPLIVRTSKGCPSREFGNASLPVLELPSYRIGDEENESSLPTHLYNLHQDVSETVEPSPSCQQDYSVELVSDHFNQGKSISIGKTSDSSHNFERTKCNLIVSGDYFALPIPEDPVYGTPVFTTMGEGVTAVYSDMDLEAVQCLFTEPCHEVTHAEGDNIAGRTW